MNERNKQQKQIRCGIYARSAVVNPPAIRNQIENCKQMASKHGWEIDNRYIFHDQGVSGLRIGRPGLKQLLDAVQQPNCPIDVLLIEETSRLGRDLSLIAGILDVLTGCGITVYTADTEVELTGPSGRRLIEGAWLVGHGGTDRLVEYLSAKSRR